MRDFTLSSYKNYTILIKSSNCQFLTFKEFFLLNKKPDKFCLIRHDVDRKPINALNMARVESELGIKSTYYFRYKPNTFKKEIILEIASLGHEIGYHYENLSDSNGNVSKALDDFEKNLNIFREIVDIQTISMHGRPLKKYDNRDLWKDPNRHKLLKEKFNILGEVYLDIDYSDIAYVNDTGRNWTNSKSNIRDKVHSNITADFNNSRDLIQYLKETPPDKICFQIHPERWDDATASWTYQFIKDHSINLAKLIVNRVK